MLGGVSLSQRKKTPTIRKGHIKENKVSAELDSVMYNLSYIMSLINAVCKLQKLPKEESFIFAFCFQIRNKIIIIFDPVTVFYILKLKNKGRGSEVLERKCHET